MGVYIGDVWIPYVSNFNVDKGSRNVEVVKHINNSTPNHYAEFSNPEFTLNMSGTVIQSSSSPKTAEDYAEDILNLLDNYAVYNYIHDFQGRSGWLSINEANCPATADKPLSRNYNISGYFMPKTLYQSRMVTYPQIRTNSYSITLGSEGADCYVPIPIDASYRGGDFDSITRIGVDGTQTLVLATTDNNIYWDSTDSEYEIGECKCYDTVISGDDTETNWKRVYDINHVFEGDCVIENNTTRCIFTLGSGAVTPKIYSFIGSAWTELTNHSFTDYIDSAWTLTSYQPDMFVIDSLISDDIVIKMYYDNISVSETSWVLYYNISNGDMSITNYVTCDSSSPAFRHTCSSTDDFEPRFICSNNVEMHDALLESDGIHGTVDTSDNWHVMLDTTVNNLSMVSINSILGGEYVRLDATDDVVTSMYIHDISSTVYRLNIGNIPVMDASKLFVECEDMSLIGSPGYYTGVDASPTTGNTGVSMTTDSHSALVTHTIDTDLKSLATYTLFIRAKDSNQVDTDLECTIINTSDTTTIKYDNFTLTGDWAYYTTDFTLDSADTDDTMTIELEKRTATANQIDLDYIIIMPKYADNADYPRDVAHQALVDKRAHREIVGR